LNNIISIQQPYSLLAKETLYCELSQTALKRCFSNLFLASFSWPQLW